MIRAGSLNTCFTDTGISDQKPAITRGFWFSDAFGKGGWWDSSGPNRQARIEGEKRQFSAPLWGQQEMGLASLRKPDPSRSVLSRGAYWQFAGGVSQSTSSSVINESLPSRTALEDVLR